MSKSLTSITDVKLFCPVCGWKTTVGEAFPDVDGDGSLGCNICFAIMKEDKREQKIGSHVNRKTYAINNRVRAGDPGTITLRVSNFF